MTTTKNALDRGDTNQLGAAALACGLGSVVSGDLAYVRTVRETVAVASAAAAPTYPVLQLLYAKTIGTGAPAVKVATINGATPAAGEASPNAGGTSVAFNAETTGTGTVDLVYLTGSPPTGKIDMMTAVPGLVG